jgi:hypothetical protein
MNNGIANEELIRSELDGKEVAALKGPLKELVHFLYPQQNGLLSCKKAFLHEKTDLILSLKGEPRHLSIKSGKAVSVHEESLTTIIPFFRSLEIPEHILKTIVYFHYGDGTLDGSGPTRFTSNDLRRVANRYFKEASAALSERRLMEPFLERFVFRGLDPNGHEVDALYYGDTKKGVFASREEILSSFFYFPFRHTGTINLGPLTYQPAVRNFYGYGEEEKRRNEAEIKWRGLYYDLGEIRKKKRGYFYPPKKPLYDLIWHEKGSGSLDTSDSGPNRCS